ncbi:MAG: sulfotransferase family 2 domain-containing protein [Pseudomonadota bacterium]
MIISRGRRFIFVHIPKTGGTSMAAALETRAMADDILIGDTPKARKRRRRHKDASSAGRLWKHSTLADIAGFVPPDVIESALIFSLVRNPWDRAFSFYCWAQMQSFDHPMVTAAHELSFSGFLRRPSVTDALQADPYARYVTDDAGVERACLWIRLEHWREDSQPLWDHLGFRLDLPHLNRSERTADYREAYSPEDAKIIENACGPDIERFAYRY